MNTDFQIELDQEEDGRWIAEITALRGVLAYGFTQDEAISRVQALALRVIAERIDNGEIGSKINSLSFTH